MVNNQEIKMSIIIPTYLQKAAIFAAPFRSDLSF